MQRRGHGREEPQDGAVRRIGRRRLLQGTGAAATVAGAVGTGGLASSASATALRRAKPAPLPIPGGFEAGPPVGFVHLFLPGPTTAVTPSSGSPARGWTSSPAR